MPGAAVGARNGLFAGRFLLGVLTAAAIASGSLAALAGGREGEPALDRDRIDRLFDDAVRRYRLPGLAVGIVRDGKVAYARTAGTLAEGSDEAIDAASLFKVASNSKAMTTALLARLVDQGKLEWDDPVVKHLPDFRMYEDWVTRDIQVRDLLIHNSGLGPGAGDLMLWPEPNLFTREDVIHGLRYLKPLHSFRSRYAYDNTLYIVAGEVAAAAGGASFDALMRREVFAPLGMDRCQVGAWERDAVGNVAQPHMRHEGANIVVLRDGPQVPDVPMMAAGGIRCSLDDMLVWMRAWLQPEGDIHGKDGATWLSQRQREALWDAHMPMPLSQQMRDWDGSHFSAYGYGWRLTDVDGTSKVSHTGTLTGMYSAVSLLPAKGVGIVFMANGDAAEARTVLLQALVKQFTAGDPDALDVAHYAGLLAAARAQRDGTGSAPATPPAAERAVVSPARLGDALGRYRDPWLGEAHVCPAGARVEFRALKSPGLIGTLMESGGRLLVDWHEVDVEAEAWVDFLADGGMRMAKTDPEADFSYDFEDLAFERIGDCAGD